MAQSPGRTCEFTQTQIMAVGLFVYTLCLSGFFSSLISPETFVIRMASAIQSKSGANANKAVSTSLLSLFATTACRSSLYF
jgi:hypothetical protein